MICLILAAGYATRMYPLTENFPKPLLDVGGKAIIDWLIYDLEEKKDIDKYIVVSNHKFIDHFKEWGNKSQIKDKLVILDDGSTKNENRLGAVKDIAFAINEVGIKDDLIVLAGDNMLDFSLCGFVDYFYKKNQTCVMRYYEKNIERLKKTGVAEIGNNERIVKMTKKPQQPNSNWAIPPFYIYSKEDIEKIERGIREGCPTDAPGSFISWLCEQSEVYAYEMPGNRFDVGSIEGYESIKKEFFR